VVAQIELRCGQAERAELRYFPLDASTAALLVCVRIDRVRDHQRAAGSLDEGGQALRMIPEPERREVHPHGAAM